MSRPAAYQTGGAPSQDPCKTLRMHDHRRRAQAAICLLAGLLTAGDAFASPPCRCDDVVYELEYTATPLNGRFLLPAGSEKATLSTSEEAGPGVSVPFRIEPAGDTAHHLWLIPTRDLDPERDYKIEGELGVPRSIHTTSERDTKAPHLGPVEASSGRFSGACPRQIAAQLVAPAARDGQVLAPLLEASISGPAGTEVVLLPGAFPVIGWIPGMECGNDPKAKAGEPYTVRVRALDLAGNASPPSEPFALRFERVKGAFSLCSVGLAVPRGGAGWPLGLLALAALARHRRSLRARRTASVCSAQLMSRTFDAAS